MCEAQTRRHAKSSLNDKVRLHPQQCQVPVTERHGESSLMSYLPGSTELTTFRPYDRPRRISFELDHIHWTSFLCGLEGSLLRDKRICDVHVVNRSTRYGHKVFDIYQNKNSNGFLQAANVSIQRCLMSN